MSLPHAADRPEIRDAATVVLVREDGPEPRVLMGQRGAGAAFMASKFVFPGGAVDRADFAMARAFPPPAPLAAALDKAPRPESPAGTGPALALAAVRETWEETGLALALPRAGAAPATGDEGWHGFLAAGHAPATGGLELIFRAVTPPGRPRRFDARFLLARADALSGDPDDLSGAGDELTHLSWLTLREARALDLPFITLVVLAELAAPREARGPVPFFRHEGGRSHLLAL